MSKLIRRSSSTCTEDLLDPIVIRGSRSRELASSSYTPRSRHAASLVAYEPPPRSRVASEYRAASASMLPPATFSYRDGIDDDTYSVSSYRSLDGRYRDYEPDLHFRGGYHRSRYAGDILKPDTRPHLEYNYGLPDSPSRSRVSGGRSYNLDAEYPISYRDSASYPDSGSRVSKEVREEVSKAVREEVSKEAAHSPSGPKAKSVKKSSAVKASALKSSALKSSAVQSPPASATKEKKKLPLVPRVATLSKSPPKVRPPHPDDLDPDSSYVPSSHVTSSRVTSSRVASSRVPSSRVASSRMPSSRVASSFTPSVSAFPKITDADYEAADYKASEYYDMKYFDKYGVRYTDQYMNGASYLDTDSERYTTHIADYPSYTPAPVHIDTDIRDTDISLTEKYSHHMATDHGTGEYSGKYMPHNEVHTKGVDFALDDNHSDTAEVTESHTYREPEGHVEEAQFVYGNGNTYAEHISEASEEADVYSMSSEDVHQGHDDTTWQEDTFYRHQSDSCKNLDAFRNAPASTPKPAGGGAFIQKVGYGVGGLILVYLLSWIMPFFWGRGPMKFSCGALDYAACKDQGCRYDSDTQECYLPSPSIIVKEAALSSDYNMLFVGYPSAETRTCINSFVAAYGHGSYLSSSTADMDRYEMTSLDRVHLYDSPPVDISTDVDAFYKLRKLVGGAQMGQNLSKQAFSWSSDKQHAASRLVLVLDTRWAVKGWLWNSVKQSGIANFTSQLEKVDTALPTPPLVILNTHGYKPKMATKVRDALRKAYRIHGSNIYTLDCGSLSPVDLSRLLQATLLDDRLTKFDASLVA